MVGLNATDWVQIGGLAANAGLLVGLIVQIRVAARTRHEDLRAAKRRATLDAWSALNNSIASQR